MKPPHINPRTPRVIRRINAFARPLQSIEAYAQQYGETFSFGSETTPFVCFSNPKAIQEIFSTDPQLFDSGKDNKILQFLLGDNSLILLDGDRHQRQRRLLMPPFHGDRIRTYSQLICDITQQVTSEWKIGKSFKIRPYMQEITLRVILQAVFGLHEGARYQQLQQHIGSLLDSISSPLSSSLVFFNFLRQDWGNFSPWGRFLRRQQQIDQLIYAEIEERRQTGNFSGDDILTLMMSARDEVGQPMTNQELRDELMTLLIAGHETTASALTWALYWVHYLPEVRDKLLHELTTLGNNPDPTIIARLPYLTAVCQETLRIYPIATFAFSRIVKSPIEITGYQFEPGTVLAPCIYLAHQRQDIYPEPKQFKPERFLARQFSPYEYFPFGGGSRRCIGAALAQLELKLALATMLWQFELALIEHRPVVPVRRGLTMAAPANLRLMAMSQRQS